MKFLILVSSVLAVATAGWAPVHEKYHGALHYPKIYKGVPVEPEEVQHAREAHLSALAAASHGHGYEHSDDYDHQDDHHHHEEESPKWHGPLHYPVIHKGVPVEPVEVQHARSAHLQAVSSSGYDHHQEHDSHHGKYDEHHYHHHYETPMIGHDGKPLDTVEVEALKAKHFAAVHEALARSSHGISHHYRKRRGAESYVHISQIVDHVVPIHVSSYHHEEPTYHGYHHIPVIGHDGTPIDTPEVQHARAEHLAAHSLHMQPAHGHYGYHYQHIPVIGHDGTPIDTPEVQHARAAHLAAHAAAKAKYY